MGCGAGEHNSIVIRMVRPAFLKELQGRALELKRQGVSVEDAGRQVAEEFHKKYPDWPNTNFLPNAVMRIYAEGK
jgi:hypothetical protein